MSEFLPYLALAASIGIGAWVLGWHYGAQSLRNRHARLIKVIENYSKEQGKREKRTGNNWYDGYSRGIADTLDSLERFLTKFKE